jgi:predicted DNA-binding transcriptional regulator YafY
VTVAVAVLRACDLIMTSFLRRKVPRYGRIYDVRASRLLSMVAMLHVRGRVSAQQLADELEVSLRTVYRDIEALSAAGVPVYAVRGRAGGYALVEGYRPGVAGLTGLTGDEADALFLTGLPGPAAELGLGGVLAATQWKLLAALPPEQRDRAARIRDRFLLDAPGWLRDAEAPAHLAVIADAAWTQRRLRVRYERSRHDLVQRTLDPLGIVLKAGSWYLVATVADRAAESGAPRTYRVSRMHEVAVLDDRFERPDSFDLRTHWDAYQADYAQRIYRETATVRLSAAGRELLFLLGPIAVRAARAGMGSQDADGWAVTTVPIESMRHGLHALLQLGADVEVLDPPELRAQFAASARGLAEHYT